MTNAFDAMMIRDVDGKPKASIEKIALQDLPDHDVLVEVSFSSLNFKDGLAITGKGRIARRLPIVAGIDLAGTVLESRSSLWSVGDKVIVNGWGLSETEWGGFARFQRLKPEWLTRLPEGFTAEEAMAVGTAGYTAALCVDALEDWGSISVDEGNVLVSGAAGGVGSTAVSLLASKGYSVVAATGRPETRAYLAGLGATDFLGREELSEIGKPLQKERWRGGVDTVGSTTLANMLAQASYGGAIAACGLAGGADLPASVMPHILRGVTLIGIDSVMASQSKRDRAWKTLSDHLDREKLAAISRTEPMHQLPKLAAGIVDGKIRGRVVINVS